MPGKKLFVNPLTRSSEGELNIPAPSNEADITIAGDTEATSTQKRSKSRDKVFEETHQRFTGWVDKELKRKFDDLVALKKTTKTALLDEAIAGLLHKQERKPYTRQPQAE